MAKRRCKILLGPGKLRQIRAGEHTFLQGLVSVLRRAEYLVEYSGNTYFNRKLALFLPGISFSDEGMENARRAFVIRRSYRQKFFRIEKSQHRKDWGTTNAEFDVSNIDTLSANIFYRKQIRDLKVLKFKKPIERSYVFVPLQSRLTKKRSFQSFSPIDMVKQTIEKSNGRPVVITLHPTVKYSKKDLRAVEKLTENPRVTLSTAPMHEILAGCDYVVTENSSVALYGVLHKKPAIVFAVCDFHHIFQYVPKVGVEHAFENVLQDEPNFVKYNFWFFMVQMIPQFAPDLENRISWRLQQLGIIL